MKMAWTCSVCHSEDHHDKSLPRSVRLRIGLMWALCGLLAIATLAGGSGAFFIWIGLAAAASWWIRRQARIRCPMCKACDWIPSNSPRAQQLRKP